MNHDEVSIPLGEGKCISALLSSPEDRGGSDRTAIVIAHGAGNDMHHPLLADIADGLAHAGIIALRFNFPYMDMGRRMPDRPEVLALTWQKATAWLMESRTLRPTRLIASGKSMGGRIASQMIAEGALPADGLLLLGYPLHPSGKKESLRDGHLYRIRIPILIFAGTRDPLCDLDLLRPVVHRIGPAVTLEVVNGGNHSFEVPKSYRVDPPRVHEGMVKRITAWLKSFPPTS
jgi:predicted alpha/beta-hydrolase family hydrolase